ncbi:hypothetical protein J6590_041603 [Homalodisca vitripennis]|nr:hypothetical protein J6590_041603 [Homalodisca vitripennis]
MLIKKSPSQTSRPTSMTESMGDNQSLKIAHQSGCLSVNLGTALGQRLYLWQMLVFPLVPIVLLVLQNSYAIYQISRDHQAALLLEEEVGQEE